MIFASSLSLFRVSNHTSPPDPRQRLSLALSLAFASGRRRRRCPRRQCATTSESSPVHMVMLLPLLRRLQSLPLFQPIFPPLAPVLCPLGPSSVSVVISDDRDVHLHSFLPLLPLLHLCVHSCVRRARSWLSAPAAETLSGPEVASAAATVSISSTHCGAPFLVRHLLPLLASAFAGSKKQTETEAA